MAKSLRSKREKRLRALRRDLVHPFYDAKDAAKLAAQEAALAAPKVILPIDPSPTSAAADTDAMDVEMEGDPSFNAHNLKPAGGVGKKKLKKKMKKSKKRGKGKVSRKFKI